MKVYKVVRKINGVYYSAVVRSIYSLSYRIGEETRPVIGKIFVFPVLADAIAWCNYSPTYTILECNTDKIEKAFKMTISAITNSIHDFWKSPMYVFKCPVVYGTAFVSKLVPIQKIKYSPFDEEEK